jgi:hypothetical protein
MVVICLYIKIGNTSVLKNELSISITNTKIGHNFLYSTRALIENIHHLVMNFNLCDAKLIGIKGSFVNNINHYWVQWIINIPNFNKSIILIFWSSVFIRWYISKQIMTTFKSHRNHLVLLEEVEISTREV